MFNKNDFFTELGFFIKDETDLDWEEVGIYLDIIDQYPDYINYILGESMHYCMKYIPAIDDGWNATKGSVVIGEFRIELCCYGSPSAINLYQNEELLEMLVYREEFDINRQIDEINTEIHQLLVKRMNLQNKLKQMA